jgi:peptidoglycan/xylan/chitin deacetylase (PgdA/CDA1 family)
MSDDRYDREEILTGRHESRATRHRDLDRAVPDFGYSPFNHETDLYRPVLDDDTDDVDWPDGSEFAVCLTHDVDHVTEHSIRQSLRRIRNNVLCWNQLDLESYVGKLMETGLKLGYDTLQSVSIGNDPLHVYEKWLEVEESVGAHSTFFFMSDERGSRHHTDTHYDFSDKVVFDGERMTVAQMMREIDGRGWEIGLHPTWPSYNDPEELRRQKRRIESVLGHEIQSVRQHYLHYDIEQTPNAHTEAGFSYDSTLGFNDNVGFRFGTSYPFELYDLESEHSLPVVEVPLIVQDNALLSQSKGLRPDEKTAFDYVKRLTREIKSVGGVLTLLWHPSAISRPTWWNLYRRILEYLDEQGAWFGSIAEVGDHWKQRSKS